jgi:hypothetical protein
MNKRITRHRTTVLRLALAVAGATGMLSLVGTVTPLWVGQQHCEPLLRH